jgi:TrmH family RNA methyltransferase
MSTSEVITSLQNPRVKQAMGLRRRRGRAHAGSILIDGPRETWRAMETNVDLIELFICEELCHSDDCLHVIDGALERGTRLNHVARNVFERLAYGDRLEGILAVACPHRWELGEIRLPDQPLVVVLEGVEKPGNLGAVVRTMDGAGASALVIADGIIDAYNPNAIRASQGTLFSLPVCPATTAAALDWLRANQLQICAARVDAEQHYDTCDFTQPTAIVLGNEAHGLTDAWNAEDIHGVGIPMHGSGDSLNVAATAAVMLYEAMRQRK